MTDAGAEMEVSQAESLEVEAPASMEPAARVDLPQELPVDAMRGPSARAGLAVTAAVVMAVVAVSMMFVNEDERREGPISGEFVAAGGWGLNWGNFWG